MVFLLNIICAGNRYMKPAEFSTGLAGWSSRLPETDSVKIGAMYRLWRSR